MTFSPAAERTLRRIDRTARIEILRYLKSRIETADNPRRFGHVLHGPLKGLWRYRVGDYRIICKIEDVVITVLVLEIGHRREIYR